MSALHLTPIPSYARIGDRFMFPLVQKGELVKCSNSHCHILERIEGTTGYFKTIIKPSRGWARHLRKKKASRPK